MLRVEIETVLDIEPKDLAFLCYQMAVKAQFGGEPFTLYENVLVGCDEDEQRRVDIECNYFSARNSYHMYVTESFWDADQMELEI
jgi:hypothetical protein